MMELKMKYFVLKPEGKNLAAAASRAAMLAYAEVMEDGGEGHFANEVMCWVQEEIHKAYGLEHE